MKKYWLSITGSLLLVLILPLLSVFQLVTHSQNKPVLRHGVMDLRDWNFEADGVVRLNGEWEFYRNLLLGPGDFQPGVVNQPVASTMISVPDKWNLSISESGKSTAKGYATYRMQAWIKPGEAVVYGVRISNIRTASRVFLNGQEIGSSGIPSDSVSSGRQNNIPYMGFAAVTGGKLEIIVQVSNYSYSSGGIIQPIVIGDQVSILKHREFALFTDGATLFGFLILSVFLLMFSRVRQGRGITLYLGLFCLAAFVYTLTHGEKLIATALPGLPYEVVLKLQLISSSLVYYYLLRYVGHSINYPMPQAVMSASKLITSLLIIIAVMVPAYYFSFMEPMLLTWGTISISFVLAVMVKGTKQNPKNRFLMMVSIESLSVLIVYYLLSLSSLSLSYSIISYEIALFGFVQAIVMTRQYKSSFLEVEQLSRRLVTLDGLKDEFMADTSYELRKPLQSIVNIALTLTEGAGGALSPQQERQLSMIISTGKRLTSLINDMSDFAKLNNGELFLKRQAVDLRMVASSVMEVTSLVSAKKGLTFRLELPEQLPALQTDEQRLAQILYNLLENAVNLTHKGVITLSAEVKEEYIAVTVADTGQGISPERLRTIFGTYDPTARAAKKTYHEFGLGLGLTQKLVELNGGRIEAQSVPGQGSAFTLTLPVLKGETAFTGQEFHELIAWETASAVEMKGKQADPFMGVECCSILIVENDPVNRQVLANALHLEGHTVVIAESGPEALLNMQDYSELDLVITNWVLPEMPGVVFCKAIRERFALSELPILVLTANNHPEDIRAAFEAGANDYLSTPVDLHEFRARVRTLLDMRKSIRTSVQTEIAFLQAQIKPHFLYNALNAIISVCPDDPETATELLLELSQYLRRSFDFHNRGQTVLIQNELDLVRSYLALEKARFDERLNIVFDVPQDIMGLVPPLSIQPIVENAVNHGLMQKESGGTVTLSIRELPRQLLVAVTDDGIGMSQERIAAVLSEERTEGGIGLRNIQRRLLKMYGTGLTVISVPGQGTTISYTIPLANTPQD
ncbi:ATP-binding protein [Paenibacillus sp. P46E]|uniref:ATP-binding protein n=1 Tax=Paenibacillus sp. P46E TaxID=1349436 RepID=UPI00093B427B|nr:ATP-binding protein [Paenibacillus sp. P46E]OKP99662.1 histidine kinase [Paenibacillus sp. P46E]